MDDYSGHQCNKRPRMGNDYNNVRVYGGKVLAGNAYNYYSEFVLRLTSSRRLTGPQAQRILYYD